MKALSHSRRCIIILKEQLKKGSFSMQKIKLGSKALTAIREADPMMNSYNVEFAEVTGGTFWKAYTPEQVAGTEEFHVEPKEGGIAALYGDLMQVYEPIDLKNETIRKRAKELGPLWIRVSGTWATKTYYDFDNETGGTPPEGYLNVLTKEQWLGVLDFVKAVDGKLMVSVANCPGLHAADEPWTPVEAEKLFSLSKAYGVPIEAAEFANEPNMMEDTGFPAGYTAADYRRDQDLFFAWMKENYPEALAVGPSNLDAGDSGFGPGADNGPAGGVENIASTMVSCDELLDGTKVALDVYSYHYYNGVSERLASVMPHAHWPAEKANSEAYLATAGNMARANTGFRDRYVPDGQMWVTESGDAGGGGDTWASTYLDVLRSLNELGEFGMITDGVIFHNTLASSDYGWLDHHDFSPRPNYFAALLWNRLMGTTVLDPQEEVRMGAHVFARSRKDGKEGTVYLIINNDVENSTMVELPEGKECQAYVLEGENGNMRARVMTLNGRPLVIGENNELPQMDPITVSNELVLAPGACAFIIAE